MVSQEEWGARREPWTAPIEDARDPGAIDYGRVVHSGSFRRLQGKTQILNLGESDFYRTRLTHTLEVAQIAGGLARQLEKDHPDHPAKPHLPGTSLIQAIGLTHDLGHPPFGHGGEVALNYCMRDHGGFEGNGQTLRILSRLEKFSAHAGANLTRRTMLGALKYPAPYSGVANPQVAPRLLEGQSTLRLIDRKASKPPKCYLDCEQDVVDWILAPLSNADRTLLGSVVDTTGKHGKPIHKSFDCSIMDLADDIAYGVHDLEDAIAMGLVREQDFRARVKEDICKPYLDHLKSKYPTESQNDVFEAMVAMLFEEGGSRKRAISRLVHFFITHATIDTIDAFEEPVLRYRAVLPPEVRGLLDALQAFIVATLILSPTVQQLEFKGQRMVVAVFETFLAEPQAFLPLDARATLAAATDKARVVCDHVAGMSDGFLLRTYDRLFSPRMGSVFDKL